MVDGWMTNDPAGQYASPYNGMGNNPINGFDPDGAYTWFGATWRSALTFRGIKKSNSPFDKYGLKGRNGLSTKYNGNIFEGTGIDRFFSNIDLNISLEGVLSGWQKLYKADLVRIASELSYISNNKYGDFFEEIITETPHFETYKAANQYRRTSFPEDLLTGGDRNTLPDFVGNSIYVEGNVSQPLRSRVKIVPGGVIGEAKATTGGVYLSSNNKQIRGHIDNVSRIRTSSGLDKFKSGFVLYTTANVKKSPTILKYARNKNVRTIHYILQYKRLESGDYKFRVRARNIRGWIFF